jgi:regulator of RNase E activity RraA
VAQLGVRGFSGTVVKGLVRSDDTIDMDLLPELARKWAPVGVANDPKNLNKNWLGNVRKFMQARYEA